MATPRRAHAARNDERILSGAMAVLRQDPSAGMEAIALGCGVSRVTIFRRYPTRDEVIAAVRARAHEDLDAAVEDAELDRGTAVEALERLVAALVEVGEQYGFLMQNPATGGRSQRLKHFSAQIERLIARGQAAGEFSDQAPPSWWVDVIVAMLQAATPREHGTELMRATLVYGLRGRPI